MKASVIFRNRRYIPVADMAVGGVGIPPDNQTTTYRTVKNWNHLSTRNRLSIWVLNVMCRRSWHRKLARMKSLI